MEEAKIRLHQFYKTFGFHFLQTFYDRKTWVEWKKSNPLFSAFALKTKRCERLFTFPSKSAEQNRAALSDNHPESCPLHSKLPPFSALWRRYHERDTAGSFKTFLCALQATSRNLSQAVTFKTLARDNHQRRAGGQEEIFMRQAWQTKTWKQVLLINR